MNRIQVSAAGSARSFDAGDTAVIGRGDAADVQLDDPRVSRHHADLLTLDGRWLLRDRSSGGTWHQDSQVREVWIDEEVSVRLGTEGAPEITIKPISQDVVETVFTPRPRVVVPPRPSTSGPAKPPSRPVDPPSTGSRSGFWILGAAVAVVLLIAAGLVAVALLGRTDRANTSEQLSQAKAATVLLVIDTSDGFMAGSGAFVAEDLILTNRHVIEDALSIEVAVAPGEDQAVEFRYAAAVEEVHPYLDIALVRITGVSELSDLNLRDLPDPVTLNLGRSSEIAVGESVSSLGFPSISSTFAENDIGELTLPVTSVSNGEVVSFTPWPGCSNRDASILLVGGSSACSPTGDLPRGNALTDDLTGSGGSGGPVVAAGEIVAVRYGGRVADQGVDNGSISTAGVAYSIPVEYFQNWVNSRL